MMPFAERLEPRRLFSAGDLDATWGSSGRVDIDLTMPLFGVQRVIPLTGGSMLVIGQEIRRFHADGSPDLTFGGGGVIPLPDALVAGNSYLDNAAVLPDGRVLAVVRRELDSATTLHELMVFHADGSPGATAAPPLSGAIDQFVVQEDGKVLAVGDTQVMRFTSDLQLDPTFGTNGRTPAIISDSAIDRAPDGSFYAVGSNQSVPPQRAIVRFTADGQVDPGFGANGEVVVGALTPDPVTEVQVDQDGTLLTVINGGIHRLQTDGQFDPSFGVGGVSDPTFGGIAPEPPRLTPLPDGKILVIEGDGITRLNADGSIDPTYGRVVANLPGRGVLDADDAGRVFFTAEGRTRTLALHRLATAGSETPGPIQFDNGVVTCIGTDDPDYMRASLQLGDLMIFRRRDDIGRVFDPADVTLLDFRGLGGNDVITLASAGWVRSTVSGGDGDDKILGGDGPDSLSGNAGRDTIYGGNGADRLGGNGARDKLIGEGGNDRLYGGSSGDWLLGAGGDDLLFGEGGNDYIQGGSGHDTLDGSAGDDLLIANDGAIDHPGWTDYLYGDGGRDRAYADPIDILSSIEQLLST